MTGPVEIEIARIAAGGAGVGRLPDGRAVFVHGSAPGELVRARVERSRPRWASARLIETVRAAPERRTPPCPYAGRSGGCTLEHLEYAAQLEAKSHIVADALERIGGARIEPPPVEPSPRQLRYRNRASFTLIRLGSGRVVAGFHALDQPARVVDISGACMLLEPALAAAWDALRGGWGRDARLLPSGERLRLTLRATADGAVSLLVDGGYGAGDPDALIEAVPALRSVWHRPGAGRAAEHVAGEPALDEHWHGEPVRLEGGVFLQVNREAAARLEAYVLERAGTPLDGASVIDAYCGIGVYGRALALRGANVLGIEADAAAVREATRTAPAHARFITARVEDAMPDALPAELVIVNPPRSGMDAAACAALAVRPPHRMIYVSCDPATLARDIARLAPALALHGVRCFDLFPQTAHVETVAELELSTWPKGTPDRPVEVLEMRYYVSIEGAEHVVDVSGGRVTLDGEPVEADLRALADSAARSLLLDGRPHTLHVRHDSDTGEWLLDCDGFILRAEVMDERRRAIRDVAGAVTVPRGPRHVRAPMPGLVVRVEVEPGDAVRAGEGLVIIEAMKMENELKADGDGVVAHVRVRPGQAVEKGAVLVEFEAAP